MKQKKKNKKKRAIQDVPRGTLIIALQLWQMGFNKSDICRFLFGHHSYYNQKQFYDLIRLSIPKKDKTNFKVFLKKLESERKLRRKIEKENNTFY